LFYEERKEGRESKRYQIYFFQKWFLAFEVSWVCFWNLNLIKTEFSGWKHILK
jgi:hypothetical protein